MERDTELESGQQDNLEEEKKRRKEEMGHMEGPKGRRRKNGPCELADSRHATINQKSEGPKQGRWCP